MIRILHYIGLLEFGGSQAFVMELYRNIDRTRMQFDFVTFPNERGEIYDEILSLGGRVFESPKYNGINHFSFIYWWDEFLANHPEYHVVHGHVRSVASIYLPIVRKHRRFSILHSHSKSNGHGAAAIVKSILQLPVRYQADYYMACSEDAGRWLFGDRVVRGKQYQTVPNAIDTMRFAYDEDTRLDVRKQLGIEDKFVIGHVGRFIKTKNHEFLIDILIEALKENPNAVLLLVGDGVQRRDVEQRIHTLGMEKSVILLGNKRNTEDYYQAMDVFAFPSFWEGLGIVAIEAQTSGLHCIVSDGVPKAVDIGADLVEWIGLDSGANTWSGELLKQIKTDRQSRIEDARKSGYDIRENADMMYHFYKKAHELMIDAKVG